MSEVHHSTDDYLACQHYDITTADESGISRFEKDGKFYFSFSEDNVIILRSEGYSSESGRENGIASVLKNLSNESLYSTLKQKDGRWVLILKAANHQEIGRSCPYQTEEEVLVLLPSARAERQKTLELAHIEAGKVAQENVTFASDDLRAGNVEDDYMICREYEEKINEKHPTYENIISFKHENTNKYYFALLNSRGEIVIRSEGYPTQAARDNGIESVNKNKDNESRWSVEEKRGLFYLILKAGNHQEIGRSCPFTSENEVLALRLSDVNTRENHKLEDDYLICREYEEQIHSRHSEYSDFIVFHHENTQKHYFAMVNDKNEIVFRSEGYPTTSARDKGLESVRKNRDIKERITVEEKRGLHYLVLKAGNHQEIGRSCPKSSEAALGLLWGGGMVAAAAGLATLNDEVPVVHASVLPVEKDDDYLHCDEYKNHKIHDGEHQLAFFEKDNLLYFVLYNGDGSVRLRSEGYINTTNRDKELESVLRLMDKPHMYEHVEKAGYLLRILKDENGNEIARTCPQKIAAAPLSGAAPAATLPAETSGKFNWWWLLLPLLLLLAYLLFTKSCNKGNDVDVSQTEVTSPETPVAVDTITETTPDTTKAVTQAVAADCGLNWILFDFDSYEITGTANQELSEMAEILKSNAGYIGILSAHTDARGSDEYNQNLSLNRAEAAKSALIKMGIQASSIQTNASSESTPVAVNTDDDSGRHFNRRVELRIKDASGKEVCKSIAPQMPENLKVR